MIMLSFSSVGPMGEEKLDAKPTCFCVPGGHSTM